MTSPALQAASFVDPATDFKEALDKLMAEHEDLKNKLIAIYKESMTIGKDPLIASWDSQLIELRHKVETFMEELEGHSDWEEQNLFPLVSLYTGKEIGPAMVMEQEHRLALQYVQAYYRSMDGMLFPVKASEAREIITFLLQTYFILIDHFNKEEEWILPVAEQMLVDIELFYS
jgi:regulator of cell morphogenesis and NO signaling